MSLRVLLTDADPVLLSIYRAFLVDQRIDVHTAANALECLEELRQWRPDVLVLDASLPGGSGLGVLVLMSEDVTIPIIPVLLLSSGSTIADKDVAIRDYALMIKPVPATVLADIIRTLADSDWGDRPRQTVSSGSRAESPGKRGELARQPFSGQEVGSGASPRKEGREEKHVAAHDLPLVDVRHPRLARLAGRRLGAPETGEATATGG